MITKKNTKGLVKVSIASYWSFFWLLNSIDKVINEPMFLWVGKDRIAQLTKYYSSIGLEQDFLIYPTLALFFILEALAFSFALLTLINIFKNNQKQAKQYFYYTTVLGLIIFTIFSIGDQIFGDRTELWEHGTFAILVLVSWFAFNKD